MVDEALARSRTGDVFSRSWRSLTGKRLDADLRPTVQYSDAAVIRLIDKVRRRSSGRPKDASVKISGAGVTTIPGVEGLAVSASQLHRQIGAAITSTSAPRTFVAHTRHTQPKVTDGRPQAQVRHGHRRQPRPVPPAAVQGRSSPRRPSASPSGRSAWRRRPGQYTIANKAVNPAWHVPNSAWAGKLAGKVIAGDDPSNPIKARWLGIFDGVGIHGTSDDASIGSNASHGCIRMHVPDVEKLYDEVPVGAAVYIA